MQLCGKVALSLSEIVGKAHEVGPLVAEIARASAEQTRGIAHVDTAVSQMDKVIPSNAAGGRGPHRTVPARPVRSFDPDQRNPSDRRDPCVFPPRPARRRRGRRGVDAADHPVQPDHAIAHGVGLPR